MHQGARQAPVDAAPPREVIKQLSVPCGFVAGFDLHKNSRSASPTDPILALSGSGPLGRARDRLRTDRGNGGGGVPARMSETLPARHGRGYTRDVPGRAAHTRSLTFTLTHSLTHCHSLTHARTHTHTHTHTHQTETWIDRDFERYSQHSRSGPTLQPQAGGHGVAPPPALSFRRAPQREPRRVPRPC